MNANLNSNLSSGLNSGLITGKTSLIGIVGWPVGHSLSPRMHNAAFAAQGLDFRYLPLPVHPLSLSRAIQGAAAMGFRGLNVTVPHKQSVMPFLDEIHPAAQAMGAVNTIRIDQPDASYAGNVPAAVLTGFNTDWSGFLADLQEQGVSVRGQECMVLGAGGSARAVSYAVASAGGRVRVFARRLKQAEELVSVLAPHFSHNPFSIHEWDEAVSLSLKPDLIVNTTPLGMDPHRDASPWPSGKPLPSTAFVYDLVYNPPVTRFLQQALASGCRVANGLGMLLWQGAQAYEIWTGRLPDLDVMRHAIVNR